MRDLVKEQKGMKVPDANLKVVNQIILIWASEDVDCHGLIFIPLWTLVGYYKVCVVNFPYE